MEARARAAFMKSGGAGGAVYSFAADTLVYQLLGPEVIGVIPSSVRLRR